VFTLFSSVFPNAVSVLWLSNSSLCLFYILHDIDFAQNTTYHAIALIAVEPTVKYSFVYKGIQTRLTGQYKEKLTLSPRLYVKPLITSMTAIGATVLTLQHVNPRKCNKPTHPPHFPNVFSSAWMIRTWSISSLWKAAYFATRKKSWNWRNKITLWLFVRPKTLVHLHFALRERNRNAYTRGYQTRWYLEFIPQFQLPFDGLHVNFLKS